MGLQSTELFGAWVWTCDHCGTDQFERSTVLEKEEIEDIFEKAGLAFTGEWATHPSVVKCNTCKREYKPVYLGFEDEDEDETEGED